MIVGTLVTFVTNDTISCALLDSNRDSTILSSEIKKTEVIVTTRAISAGELLTVQNCRVAEWPVQYIPEGYLTSIQEIDGKVAVGPIASNSVVALNVLGRAVAPIKLAPRSEQDA